MIYVRTCAYNAEKTLKRTIESILNQTNGNFIYYLLDNGSTDSTGNIIKEYAKKDKRIVPFYNKRNRDFSENIEFWEKSQNLEEGDYFCILDADDFYAPTFLEEMMRFLTENQLDMAVCGTRMLDAVTGNTCADRLLPVNIVLDNEEALNSFFPKIHWSLRAVWGKIYTAKAARARYEIQVPEWYPVYGGDTVNVYECVKASERIGVYGKILHFYTVSQKSVSYRWIEGRENADVVLFEKALELLEQKAGGVSEKNLYFLYAIHFHSIYDTCRVLFSSDLIFSDKINIIHKIFHNALTQNTFIAQTKITNEEKVEFLEYCVVQLLQMSIKGNPDLQKKLWEVFNIINNQFAARIPLEHFSWYLENKPVIVRNIALQEYSVAVNNLIVHMKKNHVKKFTEDYSFILGQNLAALAGADKEYIFFSKKLMEWCIEKEQLERVQGDLIEWMELLPNDKDIILLNDRFVKISGNKKV